MAPVISVYERCIIKVIPYPQLPITLLTNGSIVKIKIVKP